MELLCLGGRIRKKAVDLNLCRKRTETRGVLCTEHCEQRMAKRKVLREIPVSPPKTEQQSFVVVTEEAMPDSCTQILSFPARAHAKYISNDESKENITPAAFDSINKEKYEYEKSDVDKSADLTEPNNLGDQESSPGLGSDISLQQKDDTTLGMTAGTESIITPKKDTICSDWRIGESNTPMDFSKVTMDDFGISSESFINCVGKSPRSLHKHRRRSTIGVRGSPEMNFLIRQIALQRSNRKSNPEPLLLQASPFISPRNSVLKEKMSSFRNAFQTVEESEGKLLFPGFSEEDEEETQGDTPKNKVYGNTREKAEPPEKRKRVSDNSFPERTRIPVKPHTPLLSTQPQETTQEIQQVLVLEKISESDGSSSSRLITDISKSVDVQNEEILPVPSFTRGKKRKVMFADLLTSPESMETLCNQTHKSDLSTSSSSGLRPVLKKTTRKEFSSSRSELGDPSVCFLVPESSENEDNTLFKNLVDDSVKKKKRVTFGRELSPELFDRTLPANTPLRKGSTPYTDTATSTAPEAVHQSPSQPFSQPDFDCMDEEDTFKPLSLCFDTGSPSQDSSNNDQAWQMKELEDASQESNCRVGDESPPISYDFLENTTTDFPELDTDIANESFIAFEDDTVLTKSRVTRSSNRSKQAFHSEDPSTSETSQTAATSKLQVTTTTKPSSKRSRKPVIIKKVQVKAPYGKGKKSRGRPKKSVQKALYGEREVVSKKPLLSPIAELPECYPTPPASIPVSLGDTLNKAKRFPKRKGIRRDSGKVHKDNVHSEMVDSFSGPMIVKIENVTEESSCPGQEGLEVQATESHPDGQRLAEPVDLDVQVDTFSASVECPLSSADLKMKQNEECILEQGVSVPEDKGPIETMTALKPQSKSKRHSTTRRLVSQTTTQVTRIGNTENEECIPEPGESVSEDKGPIETITALKPQSKSKRHSTTQRRVSQTTTEVPRIGNAEKPEELLENLLNAEHNTTKTFTEDLKPETDLLVEDQVQSFKLAEITGVASGKNGRRSSRNYRKPAIFCHITEPNNHTRDSYATLPHPYEIKAEHNNIKTFTEEPETNLLEERAQSHKLPVITGVASGKKGRRSSRYYQKPAIFSPSTEPNIHTLDPCAMLPHLDENSLAFTSEPCLPIDEILQSTGTERKVRRSMRLRRDSGASGLFWVTGSEGTSRRKSLKSAVQPLRNSNVNLESVTYSPNKEQMSVQWKSLSSAVPSLESSGLILASITHSPSKEQLSVQQVPNAAKKTRRRTLCTSALQQTTSLCDTKRRRSNFSYKDSYVPSAETQTCYNDISLDT